MGNIWSGKKKSSRDITGGGGGGGTVEDSSQKHLRVSDEVNVIGAKDEVTMEKKAPHLRDEYKINPEFEEKWKQHLEDNYVSRENLRHINKQRTVEESSSNDSGAAGGGRQQGGLASDVPRRRNSLVGFTDLSTKIYEAPCGQNRVTTQYNFETRPSEDFMKRRKEHYEQYVDFEQARLLANATLQEEKDAAGNPVVEKVDYANEDEEDADDELYEDPNKMLKQQQQQRGRHPNEDEMLLTTTTSPPNTNDASSDSHDYEALDEFRKEDQQRGT